MPRYNTLKRPRVANVDKVIIVLAATVPAPDLMLVDKLVISAVKNKIQPVICINKSEDINEAARILKEQYFFFPVIVTSALTGRGIEELKEQIKDSCVCLAGQSAVGKSSLINAIRGDQSRETGILSKKTARGKHTTRMTELIPIPVVNGIICDTPGFSVLDDDNISSSDIINGYPELWEYLNDCRFSKCNHLNEPDCGVLKAVDSGLINKERYMRYKTLTEENLKSEVEKWSK